jgi:hypothetical protein
LTPPATELRPRAGGAGGQGEPSGVEGGGQGMGHREVGD